MNYELKPVSELDLNKVTYREDLKRFSYYVDGWGECTVAPKDFAELLLGLTSRSFIDFIDARIEAQKAFFATGEESDLQSLIDNYVDKELHADELFKIAKQEMLKKSFPTIPRLFPIFDFYESLAEVDAQVLISGMKYGTRSCVALEWDLTPTPKGLERLYPHRRY